MGGWTTWKFRRGQNSTVFIFQKRKKTKKNTPTKNLSFIFQRLLFSIHLFFLPLKFIIPSLIPRSRPKSEERKKIKHLFLLLSSLSLPIPSQASFIFFVPPALNLNPLFFIFFIVSKFEFEQPTTQSEVHLFDIEK